MIFKNTLSYFPNPAIFRLICFCILIIFFSSCEEKGYEELNHKTIEHVQSNFVGSKSCVECHDKQSTEWKGSHHDLAMQIANDQTVLGDFNNVKAIIDQVEYFFFRKNDEFRVNVKEVDGSETEYKISFTFGVTPLQQYLIDFDKGQKQVLRVTWDVIKGQWYHQYKGDVIESHDWLHWTKGAQNWNTMCAECHSTNLIKNYDINTDSYNTTYSEINVACESCHGKGSEHVNWARENPNGLNNYIIKGSTQNEQINLCAPCHARRVKLDYNLEYGLKFENQYLVQNITTDFYHGDGQIDDEVYVLGSFMQSKMYMEGVMCSDCHDPHTLTLKHQGNDLCLQCHLPENYDNKGHYFHEENTEASLCINCHMTGKNYMGDDFRRDHSFRLPRPDQSEEYGTPNACTGCHKNKSNKWAAEAIVDWYGEERSDHFSDGLLLSSKSELTEAERKSLDEYINNLQYPEIARATVIENLYFSTENEYSTLLISLNDSSAVVRYNALLKFRALSPQYKTAIALKHMTDSIKLVRIGAAQLVIGLDDNTLSDVDRVNFSKTRKELETMLFSSADFSTGRMLLGDYYLQLGDYYQAIDNYKLALFKDSLLIPVYSNLATSYTLVNDYVNAEITLNKWMTIAPNEGRPHFLKGLMYFEINDDKRAVEELDLAIKLDPNDVRSMYNIATYYFQENRDLDLAEFYIAEAIVIDPLNSDFKYLLGLIYQQQGKTEDAQMIFKQLNIEQ